MQDAIHAVDRLMVADIIYDYQGRYSEAEPLYHRALVIREKVLGSDHPDTVAVVKAYSALLRHLGRYGEASAIQFGARSP
jgi:tetratricopeptide (TPR) repeat protein